MTEPAVDLSEEARWPLLGIPGFSYPDLHDALRLAVEGKVRPHVERHELDRAPELMQRLHRGEVNGRAVVVFS